MGIKGKKRKLRQMLREAEARAEQEGDAASEGEVEDEMEFMENEELPPGVGPSMASMQGGKMKTSMMNAMNDEMQVAAAIEGKGEKRRKKRKPWWERSDWWVGKVPGKEGGREEQEMEAVPYYPPRNLPQRFDSPQLGLDKRLVASLTKEGFIHLTEIQRRCIPEILNGKDIVGQAKTGSGKTLAFVVPMLSELLAGDVDLGATRGLIISPTKELCHQIVSVAQRLLSNINTGINAELITGGTKVSAEAAVLTKGATLVVATPGRLLDHMRNTKGWKWKKMIEYLVIDEADRVLMEGFQKEIDAILKFVADVPNRTTALFSATMARGMADLGRLSFVSPPLHITDVTFHHTEGEEEEAEEEGDEAEDEECEEMEDAEEEEEEEEAVTGHQMHIASKNIMNLRDKGETFQTPVPTQRLKQVFMIVKQEEKLVQLYRLLKDLTKKEGAKKIIVFFASCASAQFHCMMLNTILEGSLQCLMLHGKMKHRQRVATFDHFCAAPDGVLFSTDVSARGLDIPAVEWIVQYDPPTDPSEYLHRVGRTARGGGSGSALLMLTPKEKKFLSFLHEHGLAITERPAIKLDIGKYNHKLHQIILEDNILEKNARSAFTATLMSYQQHTLKKCFNVKDINQSELAHAFCLGDSAPQVHLSKTDGERAPYINGILKSMKQKFTRQKRWEKKGKAKKQWSNDGVYIGRKPLAGQN